MTGDTLLQLAGAAGAQGTGGLTQQPSKTALRPQRLRATAEEVGSVLVPPHQRPSAAALQSAYRYNEQRPVAYLDETYRTDPQGGYYVMTAAVVQADQRDRVRADIRSIAGDGYWHTTESLRTPDGLARTRSLLDYLGDPAGTETYFIAHEQRIEDGDPRGELARTRCLTSLLVHLNGQETECDAVDLFVLEKRLTGEMTRLDARTKAAAQSSGLITKGARLFQTTPSDEHLLWLPDLVCSAYRHSLIGRTPDLYPRVSSICTVLPQK